VPQGLANASELAVIVRVLNAHCNANGTSEDVVAREQMGALLVGMFYSGIRTEVDLASALYDRRRRAVARKTAGLKHR
jgi:hypothetical protein